MVRDRTGLLDRRARGGRALPLPGPLELMTRDELLYGHRVELALTHEVTGASGCVKET